MGNTNIASLQQVSLDVRKGILKMTNHAGCGHVGGSLSETDILVALYFHAMNIDPKNPRWNERDRFILSKGHATPGYYTVLAKRGFFPEEDLLTFDSAGSFLQGHPDMHKTPGIDISSGSLGQGLSLGIGMRLGGEAKGQNFNVFVLVGDGESQEGQVWEAAMYAFSRKVKGLIGITDYNRVQLSGTVEDTVSLGALSDKWSAFGWHVLECDGHDMDALVSTLDAAKTQAQYGPVMMIASTTKGKGVSFMENDYRWHGRAPNDGEYRQALAELDGKKE